MSRIVILGNAGGGKSTLARKLGEKRGLPHVEIDRFLWQEGWILTPPDVDALKHEKIISEDAWVIDGLGSLDSIPSRVARATEIILIDMALWMHFWLAAERQMAWMAGNSNMPQAVFLLCPPRASFSARFGMSIKDGCRQFESFAQRLKFKASRWCSSAAWTS